MDENKKNSNITKPCIRCTIGKNDTLPTKKTKQMVVNYNFVTTKKTPSSIKEMQQNFNQQFTTNAPQKNVQNNALQNNNTTPQNNEMNMLSQIAPMFNLLSGGKNPEIGNLISALSSGNMDMNKMLNSMVQSQTASKTNKTPAKPVSAKPVKEEESQIKNLKRI
jgi:predicted trehalose synthase